MLYAQKAAAELEEIAKELLAKIEETNTRYDESDQDYPTMGPFEVSRYRDRIAQACLIRPSQQGRDVTAELKPAIDRLTAAAEEAASHRGNLG